MTNGDFELGSLFLGLPDDWITFNNAAGELSTAQNNTPGGQFSVSIPPQPGFNAWEPALEARPMFVPIPPDSNGGPLTLSFFVNMPEPVVATVVGASMQWFTATGTQIGATGDLPVETRDTGGDWVEATFELTPPTGAVEARPFFFVFTDGDTTPEGTVFFDDVSLTQVEGVTADSEADLAEPFGELTSADVQAFLDLADEDEVVLTIADNRVGNPSFEESRIDPEEGELPVGWFEFNLDPGSDFYEVGGENGAPLANTGDRLLRLGDDIDTVFQGWTTLPEAAAEYNLVNPLIFTGFFNIPEGAENAVVGTNLEFITVDDEGNFSGLVGATGDLLIGDGSPTDGYVQFSFEIEPEALSPAGDVVRPLLILFDPGGIEGEIFFDDIFIGQEDELVGDFNVDGDSDIFDVIDYLAVFDADS